MAVVFISAVSLGIWLFLLLFWGNFWRADCRLDRHSLLNSDLEPYPTVCAVVPARDESETISTSLSSLLGQDYDGQFSIVLVDDNSRDRTAKIAHQTALDWGTSAQLQILQGKPLESGWKGKLWALHQGIASARANGITPDYWLFTDADIQHSRSNLTQLVTKAKADNLALVSLMVLLHCQSFWEKLLIPAFVFFFQKLYPFAWVNDPDESIGAAAGGCILISDEALTKIGGIAAIEAALIDDCSLGQAVKDAGKNIWLGLSETTVSLRSYDSLKAIWGTISRTAYTQLSYSFPILVGTVISMVLIYLAAPIALVWGIATHHWLVVLTAIVTWSLMIYAYLPTLRLYQRSWLWGILLPAIAALYTLMTIDSAIAYYQGRGGAWKGRTY